MISENAFKLLKEFINEDIKSLNQLKDPYYEGRIASSSMILDLINEFERIRHDKN